MGDGCSCCHCLGCLTPALSLGRGLIGPDQVDEDHDWDQSGEQPKDVLWQRDWIPTSNAEVPGAARAMMGGRCASKGDTRQH